MPFASGGSNEVEAGSAGRNMGQPNDPYHHTMSSNRTGRWGLRGTRRPDRRTSCPPPRSLERLRPLKRARCPPSATTPAGGAKRDHSTCRECSCGRLREIDESEIANSENSGQISEWLAAWSLRFQQKGKS